jgi:hypothetical protein
MSSFDNEMNFQVMSRMCKAGNVSRAGVEVVCAFCAFSQRPQVTLSAFQMPANAIKWCTASLLPLYNVYFSLLCQF